MNSFYLDFKKKYRNSYYLLKSKYEFFFKYVYFNLLKLIFIPLLVILYPLYKYLYKKKIFFLADIMSGVGHLIPEFDFFYLRYNNYQKVIFINNGHQNYKIISSNYNFYKIYSGKYFIFFLLFLNFYPRLNLVSSQTLPDHKKNFNIFSNKYNTSYYFKYYNRYLKLRKKKNSFFKLYAESRKSKNFFLKIKKKIACIHYRENISTAVPQISNPDNYIKSIKYLKKMNYNIYFIGRENMPISFKQLDIIDYAAYPNITIDDDLDLIYSSDINIICGSGISYLPDVLDKKYLYINSWHISRPGGIGKYSIFVPSIIKKNSTKKILNFSSQAKLENSSKLYQSPYLSISCYQMIHPSEEEVYRGLLELLDLEFNKQTQLQLDFKKIIEKYGWDSSSCSRISNFFLQKNKNLLY